jgi:hypothetical protein
MLVFVVDSEVLMEQPPHDYLESRNNFDYPMSDEGEERGLITERKRKKSDLYEDAPRPKRKIVGPNGEYEYFVLPYHEEMTTEEYEIYMMELQQFNERQEF